MKQKNLFVLVGCPGCGKSTWAKKYAAENNLLHVSRDEIRFSLVNENEDYFAKEGQVFETYINTIQKGLNDDKYDGVIADATHLGKASRQKLLHFLELGDNVHIIYVYFNVTLKTCSYRNKMREGRRQVPENILKNMFYGMTDPTLDNKKAHPHVWYINEEGERDDNE